MAGIWTRNYYNWLTGLALSDTPDSSSSQPTTYDPPIMLHASSGSWVKVNNSDFCPIENYNIARRYGYTFAQPFLVGKTTCGYGTSPDFTTVGMCVQFGTGTATATYEDYVLNSPITSGLSIVSASGLLTQKTILDGTHLKTTRDFTVSNTSASPITLNEFGVFLSDGSKLYLVYREVFDMPIVLNPSENVVISFNRDAEIYNYTPY